VRCRLKRVSVRETTKRMCSVETSLSTTPSWYVLAKNHRVAAADGVKWREIQVMYNNGRSYLCRFKVKPNTHFLRVASSHGCSMMETTKYLPFSVPLAYFSAPIISASLCLLSDMDLPLPQSDVIVSFVQSRSTRE